MKRKVMTIFMALSLFCMNATVNIVHAEEDETINVNEDADTEGEEGTADYDVSGYEAWLPDYNPRARGFESGSYNRSGNFLIGTDSTGAIQTGTAIKTGSWGPDGFRVYVAINGSWVERTTALTVREYANVSGTFTLKRARSVHTMPAFGSKYRTGETLPAGTYQVTKESMEFVELVKPDGSSVWVSPQYEDDGNTYRATNYGVFDNTLSTLSVNSVNGAAIKQWFMPIREDKRTGISMKPQYVTIHNTASSGWGANAWAHANGQIKDSRTWVSWHYTVDNNEIYQSIPMNEGAYHAGDGNYMGNAATVGIEICENSDGNYAKAERNAAYLTAQILYENGMPSDAVRMHGDWSGKHCAHNIMDGTKGTMGWTAFKALVKQEYDRLTAENSVDIAIPNTFKDMMANSSYKFDSGFVSGVTFDSSLRTIQDKLKSLDSSINIEFKKGGSVVSADTKLATGQQVTVTKGNETFRFMTVVKGDTNGDGKISSLDYAYVKNHILSVGALTGAYNKAGNVNGDSKISSLDYAFIKNHILKISQIQQ